jgi:hypothetical protein
MKHEDKQVTGLPGTVLKQALPLLLFVGSSILLYLPVIKRQFVSDDFKVLYRVCIEKNFFTKGFFRPLSDISIFMNYNLAGFNPILFNSFNIVIHGVNSYLVYLTSLFFFNSAGFFKKKQLAVFSSLIFLSYPFHNEAVVWLLGRGASLACMLSLLSVVCYYTIENISLRNVLVCLFYFLSISAFESTILFPLIFMITLWAERGTGSTIRNWAIMLFSTLFLHLVLRYAISQSLMGHYGNEFFHSGFKVYFLNAVKTAGRLFLPPTQNAELITAVFILLFSGSTWYLLKNLNKIRSSPVKRRIISLSGMLLVSCFIPIISGISTQTSETDRALYYPSVFLCMILGLLFVFGIKKSGYQTVILFLILSYNIFFLEKNNKNWIKASEITQAVINKTLEISRFEKNDGRTYFLNIPNEIEGAYVFRLGFPDALRIYKADSQRFVVLNYLPRQDLEKMEKIVLDPLKENFMLPPDVMVRTDSAGCRKVYDHGELRLMTKPDDRIFFWNLDDLEEIQSCIQRKPV